jgi:hypothetical protein
VNRISRLFWRLAAALVRGARVGVGGFRRSLAESAATDAGRHPGVVYDPVTSTASKPGTNPHVLSWVAYGQHLHSLLDQELGDSPAVAETRRILEVHWAFLSTAERAHAKRMLADSLPAIDQGAADVIDLFRHFDRVADKLIRRAKQHAAANPSGPDESS